MGKSVTMKDIGAALGISTVSVSNALSGKDGVSDEMRLTVMQKAQEMGYVYAGHATQAAGRANTASINERIGVLVANRFFSGDSYYASLYALLAIEAARNNMFSLLEILPPEAENALRLPAFLADSGISSFIVLGQMSSAYITALHTARVPYVFLDFYDEKDTNDAIVADSMYGSYLLTRYLIKQGHSDIGFVGNMKATSSIMDRYLGYHSCILRHGLVTRAECLVMDRDTSSASGIFDTFRLPDTLPTAFVCNCDDTALRLVRQLNRMGVKVPDDVSVVGYDDHITATICDPPLTTFSVDKAALVRAAIEAVIEKTSAPDIPVRRKIIGGDIVYRQSVCAPSGATPP